MFVLLLSAALAETPDLSGDWELVLSLVISAKIPVFGPTELTTTTTMLAHIDGTHQTHTTCQVAPSSPLRMVTTTIPDRFIQQIADKSYPIVLGEDGSYTADFGPQYIAYDPALSDGMPPSTADHPAVLDWEGDGQPGATIYLDAPLFGRSEVYITQLAHTQLIGQVHSAESISGALDVLAMQQRSIGAQPAMFASNTEAHPVPDKSRFVMRRVPDGTTCDDL